METAEQTQAAPEAPVQETPTQEAPRSFTQDEVNKIVSERVNAYSKYGKPEELEAKLQRLESTEKWAGELRSKFGNPDVPGKREMTEEDKKVLAYMERLQPGFSKWQEEKQMLAAQMQQLAKHQWDSISERNENALRDMASKAGYKPEHFDRLNEWVANSIRGNPKDLQDYLQSSGRAEIVKKHFDAIHEALSKGFGAPVNPANDAARKAADAKKISGLPQRMPQGGGVPAPTAKKGKMTNEERIDAAFAQFTGKA